MANIIKIKKILDILEHKYAVNEELTELSFENPYTLLVAVILSAQATDKGVNKATEHLFKIIKTPEDMVKLGSENLREYIKSINYYNNKAKNIINMSHKLIDNFNSKVPDNMKDLLTLDGVGRKTANIILNVVHGIPAIAVDTHVFRVSNRLGLVDTDNVKDTENELMKIIPKKYIKYINNNFVLFGRYICKAIRPLCDTCELSQYCKFYKNNK